MIVKLLRAILRVLIILACLWAIKTGFVIGWLLLSECSYTPGP